MPEEKLPIPQFAAKIKAKYPEYKDVNDTLLVQKIVAKYPEYKESVDLSGIEEPIKKKEPSPIGSLVGSVGGKSYGQSEEGKIAKNLQSVQTSPETDEDIKRQRAMLGVENFDDNDPARSFLTPLRARRQEIVDRNLASESTGQDNKIKRALDSNEVDKISLTEDAVVSELFPTINYAENWLKQHPATEDNETSKIAFDLVNDKNMAMQSIANYNGSLKGAAIDYTINRGGEFGEQLKVMRDSGAEIPHQLEGIVLNNFLQNRAIKELPQSHPVKKQAEQEMRDFYVQYPEIMNQNILFKIAQGREDYGLNNAFANIPGKFSSDIVIKRLADDGKISDEEIDFYQKHTRDMISLGAADIPTPGLVENVVKSSSKSVGDTFKSLYEATGARDLLFGKGEILSRNLEEDLAATPQPKYKGLLRKVTNAAGGLAGIVLPIGGEAKLLQGLGIVNKASTAHKLATGLTFYHDIEKAERQRNPNNSGLLHHLSALLQTGVWMQGSEIFGNLSRGITREISPEINTVLKSLEKGEINNAVATKSIVEKVFPKLVEAGGKSIDASAKITGYTMLNNAISGILNGDYNLRQNIVEGAQTFEHMMLAMPLLEVAKIPGAKNMTAEYLNEIAQRPEKYKESLQTDEQKKNFEYLLQVNKALEGREDLTPEQRKKFQLLSLQKKILQDEIVKSPDKDLIRNHDKQLRTIEVEKEIVLDTEKTNTDIVQEFYENDLLGKGSKELLSIRDEEGNPTNKFDQSKVGEYLKEVAQRTNNLDSEWNVNKVGDSSEAAREAYPEAIIEAANERWKKEIEASKQKEETIGQDRDLMDEGQEPETKISVIRPEENKPPNVIEIKKENETIQEPTKESEPIATEEVSGVEETFAETGEGAGKEPPKGNNPGSVGIEEGEALGITHAANEVRRKDRGLPEYERSPQSFEEWNNKAETLIKNGYDVDALIDRLERGDFGKDQPIEIENAIRKIYVATLDAEIAKNPTDELLAKQKRFIEVGDPVGTALGRGLASLKGVGSPLESISDFYVAKMEASGVDKLTEEQKRETQRAFYNVQRADENAAVALEAYEAEIAKLKAENELLKQAKSKKPSTSKAKPKTREDFVKERDALRDKLAQAKKEHEDYLKNQGIQKMGGGLFSLTPKEVKIISEIIKSHVEEIGTNLSEVTKKVYEAVKDIYDGISEKDIHNIIAGEYAEKRPTRSELAAKMRDLKDEAYYVNKLEKLLKGEEPKNEKAKVKRNRQIAELGAKIKDISKFEDEVKKAKESELFIKAKEAKSVDKELSKVEKEMDAEEERERKKKLADAEKERKTLEREFEREKKAEEKAKIKARIDEAKRIEKELSYRSPEEKALDAIIERNKKQTAEIKERIAKGDFETKKKQPFLEDAELKRKFPKEHKAALDAIVAREEARHEFDIALLKDQMAKRGAVKKYIIDPVGDIIGTTKALVTGIDASGMGIQNLVAMIAHPRSAAKALPASFTDFVSAKNQDRWLASVHNSSLFPLAQKAGLDITEPKSLKASEREEIFTHNLLDKGVKFRGKKYVVSKYTTKPFERIFAGLGNRMRWNLWQRGVEKLYEEGYTWEKHPEQFESLAKILNTETGRGSLHPQINKAFNLVSAGIWSPRLMASRMNILGIGDIGNLIAGGKKGYYGGLTPKMRAYAVKDLAKFVSFGTIMLGLAGLTFADEVELDPNSSTFGTFLVNGKRYNIWGGFTQYVRLIAKLARGGENTRGEFRPSPPIKTGLRFLWSKTTPAVGTGISLANKGQRDYMGQPVTGGSALESLVVPLSIRGISEGVKKEGLGSIIWTGIPSFGGMNVSYESDFKDTNEKKKL